MLLLLLVTLLFPCEQDLSAKTVGWLHSCRHADGGYGINPASPLSTLSASSAAVRALKYWGGAPEQPAKTKAFVWSCYQSEKGQFSETPGSEASYRSTAVGVMAMVVLGERFTPADLSRIQVTLLNSNQPEEVRLGAAAIESLCVAGQLQKVPTEWQPLLHRVFKKDLQPDGTYGAGPSQARTTAGYVAAFLRLGYPVAQKQRVLELLKEQQHAGGGWTNEQGHLDLEATYRVMRCLYLLRTTDAQVLQGCEKFIGGCRQNDGGFALPGGASTVSGTYFAGSIANWLKELRK